MDVAKLVEISDASSSLHLNRATPERALHTANLCLRLLLSKESIVIRRLVMTAVCTFPCFPSLPESTGPFGWISERIKHTKLEIN